MPQTAHGYPYPDGTAKVGEFDLHVKALAEKVEANVKRIESGSELVTVTAANTVMTKAVLFAQPFDSPPNVVIAPSTSAPQQVLVSTSDTTVNGFNIRLVRTTGTTNTGVRWIAHG